MICYFHKKFVDDKKEKMKDMFFFKIWFVLWLDNRLIQ
jgi:hypothetical protein